MFQCGADLFLCLFYFGNYVKCDKAALALCGLSEIREGNYL